VKDAGAKVRKADDGVREANDKIRSVQEDLRRLERSQGAIMFQPIFDIQTI
jgi:hypothetical protein